LIFLIRHIEKTANIAGGFTVGTLVIESQGVFLQLDDGSLVPATGKVEVKNGGTWQTLAPEDFSRITAEGWPAYAGMDARMMN
jgi:hypothetical protein